MIKFMHFILIVANAQVDASFYQNKDSPYLSLSRVPRLVSVKDTHNCHIQGSPD